jgi:flagellar hook-associated protein 1 FlgK
LNGQIATAEIGSGTANDLRDQRDQILTQIAEFAEVTIDERSDGSVDVILAGRTMVTRGSYEQLETTTIRTADGDRSMIVTVNGQPVDLAHGYLEGLLTARDVHVVAMRQQLDDVVSELITSVNELHVQGRSGGVTGIPFFVGDSLQTIGVAEAIRNDPSLVATSRSGASGDHDIALAIAALADQGRGGPGDPSINERYRGVLVDLAGRRSSFAFLLDNQDSVIESVRVKIASVSGVSLDEEGANMVRYQNTYTAAAKVIATVQEMYESLLQMI